MFRFLFVALVAVVCINLVEAGGTPRREDMPKYLKMLQSSKTGKDRALAAEMIGKRGLVNANDVEDAIETLKTTLQKDVESKVRAAAATALGNIKPPADDMVPLFIDRVKNDKAKEVQLASTVALGQYGAEAKSALPTLREFSGKFDNKKSADAQTITAAIKSISGKKK